MFGGSDIRKRDYLSRLSTEELEELLRADMAADNSDPDLLLHVMEVIAEREKETIDDPANTDRAWREFQELYNTPEGIGRALYPTAIPALNRSAAQDAEAAPRRHIRHSFRRIAVIAAIVVIVLGFMVPTAFGYGNFYQMIGQWTKEIFQFHDSSDNLQPQDVLDTEQPKSSQSGEYQSLQEALADYGIPATAVPSKVPDGFELQLLEVFEYQNSGEREFFAYYTNETAVLNVAITQHTDTCAFKYEKGDIPVEKYVSNGIEYYIFANEDQTTVAWYTDYLEGAIYGDVSAEDLKMMIGVTN